MNHEKQIGKLLEKGLIKRLKPQRDQIYALLKKSKKDINTAKELLKIDIENAYTIAYNSMLKSARAFIISKGFRTDDGAQHKTTIDLCRLFLGEELEDKLLLFDDIRKNRNLLSYDPVDFGEMQREDAQEAIATAEKIFSIIEGRILRGMTTFLSNP